MRPFKLILKKRPKVKDTKVYNSIINSKNKRRNIDTTNTMSSIIDGLAVSKHEYWGGGVSGYEVNGAAAIRIEKDIRNIKERFKNKKMNVMLLGVGKGAEAKYVHKLLEGIDKSIDTTSLTDSLLPDVKDVVRKHNFPKDISVRYLFEHANHLEFVNKYDYIFSSRGPGELTKYPEIVLLKVASMLKKDGIAAIDTHDILTKQKETIANIKEYLFAKKQYNVLSLEINNNFILIKRLK